MIAQVIATKTVDVNTWNALLFVVTSLITVILGVIAWYQKDAATSQKLMAHDVNEMSKELVAIKINSENMHQTVERINLDVEKIATICTSKIRLSLLREDPAESD